MKDTLIVINQMVADGIIGKYAIGGAVGATFYLEPSATLDIDIFVALQQAPNAFLLSLEPIYKYLVSRGCKIEGECIKIGSWPVQFLPLGSPLEVEALDRAIQTQIEGVPTWVMTAEHLVAIALKVGRSKDFNRILQFVEEGVLDSAKLDQILTRHDLLAKWEKFGDRYLKQ